MTITLPLGARLAAERAYNDLPREHRRDPGRVAEALLTAAVPFMAPAVAQLGRGRITPDGAADILRYWLSGQTTAALADRFAVTPQTINKYVQRGLLRTRKRLAAGTPIGTIAAENQVTPTALRAVLDNEEARRAA
jgi:DNA-directed RNA polymerase specialized sigma24 family protein